MIRSVTTRERFSFLFACARKRKQKKKGLGPVSRKRESCDDKKYRS